MVIDYDNDDIKALVNHNYIGIYKKYRSNAKLIRNLDKVIKYLENAKDIATIRNITSLHYEVLKGNNHSSLRVGFDTKYRLIFDEKLDNITILLIELNEHYGDH
mgnify:CR=1 FL=1